MKHRNVMYWGCAEVYNANISSCRLGCSSMSGKYCHYFCHWCCLYRILLLHTYSYSRGEPVIWPYLYWNMLHSRHCLSTVSQHQGTQSSDPADHHSAAPSNRQSDGPSWSPRWPRPASPHIRAIMSLNPLMTPQQSSSSLTSMSQPAEIWCKDSNLSPSKSTKHTRRWLLTPEGALHISGGSARPHIPPRCDDC